MAQEISEIPGKQLTLLKGLVPFPLFLFLLLSPILLLQPTPNHSSALPSYTVLSSGFQGYGAGFAASQERWYHCETLCQPRKQQPRPSPRPSVSSTPATSRELNQQKIFLLVGHISLIHQAWALQVGVIQKPQARVK